MKYHLLTSRLFLTKLFLFIILYNLTSNIITGADVKVPPTNKWLQREMDIINRSEIPKKILLGVNIGGWSHLRHVLTIADILADRGYNITLVTRGTFPQSPQYPKINFISLGENFDFSQIPNFDKLVYEKNELTQFKSVFSDSIDRIYNSTFLKLKEISETVKPDLFFCDTLNNDACFDVAWLMKKPLVGIANSALGLVHVPYKSDPILGCKVNMEDESFWQRFKCEILSPIKFIWHFSSSYNKVNEIRVSNGLPILSDPYDRWKNSLFLIDTFFGFETPIHLPPLYQEIGPVLSDYFPPLTPVLEEFITSHKRTMFVALGTLVYLSPENNAKLLQSFVESIENNLIDGVIWANIKERQESFLSNITLSDGRIISTSDIFDNKHPNIHITSYAPQFAILNHVNTKVFLSHSGSGSIYESLFTGTPILALPITFDQPANAEKLVSAGVALQLDKTDLHVNDILYKIEKLQKDEQIQISLKRLKNLAMINSKRKYIAADLIEYVLYSSILKRKDTNDEDVTKWVFKELITPDTRMGFIRGKYLDVYATALAIVVGILIASLWGLFITGKLIFRKLLKLFRSEDKEKEE